MEDDKYFIGFGNESHISSPVTSCRVWVSLFNGPGSQLHTATNRNRKTVDSGRKSDSGAQYAAFYVQYCFLCGLKSGL